MAKRSVALIYAFLKKPALEFRQTHFIRVDSQLCLSRAAKPLHIRFNRFLHSLRSYFDRGRQRSALRFLLGLRIVIVHATVDVDLGNARLDTSLVYLRSEWICAMKD
jgi:hypothetical protein